MPFQIRALSRFATSSRHRRERSNAYVYTTEDSAADVQAAGYFNGALDRFRLRAGDIIDVAAGVLGSPAMLRLAIVSIAAGVVSVSAPDLSLVNSNRFRTPYSAITGTGNRYASYRFYMGQCKDPEYALQFFLPLFGSATGGGETALSSAQSIRIVGLSFGYASTKNPAAATWTRGTLKGVQDYTMNSAVDGAGVLTDPLLTKDQITPANSHRWLMLSVDYVNGVAPTGLTINGTDAAEGVMSSATEGAFLTTNLTSGAAMSGSGTMYGPSYSLSKSINPCKAVSIFADSIGYGDIGENIASNVYGVQGYIKRGLIAAGGVGEVYALDLSIPGSNPANIANDNRLTAAGLGASNDPSKYALKWASVDAAPNVPFTHMISEHITNGGFKTAANANVNTFADLKKGMKAYADTLKAKWPGLHLAQCTAIQKLGLTTDGGQTEAGQTEAVGFAIGGYVDQWNEDLVATKSDGAFDSVIDARPYLAGATRTKLKPYNGPIATTVTAFTQGTNKVTVADASQIPKGDAIVLDPDGVGASLLNTGTARIVTVITGNELTLSGTVAQAVPVGAKVIGTWTMDMIHPPRQAHIAMSPAATNWRNANLAVAA